MSKSYNSGHGRDRDDSEETARPVLFENVPSSIHLGDRSEMTDSNDGFAAPQSEVTDFSNVSIISPTPLTQPQRQSRLDLYNTIAARSPSRSTGLSLTIGLIKPSVQFSQEVKNRWKLTWELLKLNYRMLISLTLTSFVAGFVSPLT